VGYYGVGIEAALGEAERINVPLSPHIAESDRFCPPEARTQILNALEGHRGVSLHVYRGCDRAFARPGRQPRPHDDRRCGLPRPAPHYTTHFADSNPPDTSLVPISRTVGAMQVVDEMLFCFTHTTETPWMLPGIAPTGRRVEIPLLAVVKLRGDKLWHEHIDWDRASVLVQIGLLEDWQLPVAGVETARKLKHESLLSNTLMERVRR
jgi:carboxymethylenebutenolidase